MPAPTPRLYAISARILHWTMAALILVMLFAGAYMVSLSSAERQGLLAFHKSVGVAILVLGAARLAVRAFAPPPPAPPGEPLWRLGVAKATHLAFYALIFLMPLLGWAMQSAAGYPVEVFGVFRLPPLAPEIGRLHAILRAAHALCAYAFFGLILLHLTAGLFHGLILQDGTLRSMTFNLRRGSRAE